MSTILVVAAHPDDEILGVGATIVKHIKKGDKAYALVLGEGQTSRTDKRSGTDASVVEALHSDSERAAAIIGFEKLYLENLPDNRFDEWDLLDVVKVVEKYVKEIKPDIIYTHHGGDLNVDHQYTYKAVMTATRPVNNCPVKEIYCFETVSSTEWNFAYGDDAFKPNVFVDVTDTFDVKLEAMKEYKSELAEFPHPRSLENLSLCAKRWGGVTGCQYVEAFEVMRVIK